MMTLSRTLHSQSLDPDMSDRELVLVMFIGFGSGAGCAGQSGDEVGYLKFCKSLDYFNFKYLSKMPHITKPTRFPAFKYQPGGFSCYNKFSFRTITHLHLRLTG